MPKPPQVTMSADHFPFYRGRDKPPRGQRIHVNTLPYPKDQPLVYCPICAKGCKGKEAYDMHYRAVHFGRSGAAQCGETI